MCLGALVDAGVPLDYLMSELERLGMSQEYQLSSFPLSHQGQVATKVEVTVAQTTHPHRHLSDIESLIRQANLPPRVEKWSIEVFSRLAIAEGEVHGVSPEQVHFHEVGATDAIVDIVGTCLGLHWLGVEKIHCSAFPTGGGTVKASHGELSVPVPAVVRLWESRHVPVYSNGLEKELVTPTGAALMVTLAASFGAFPAMRVEKVGFGAGNRRLSLPNVLRLWVGETTDSETLETVAVLETQVDDLSPQVLAYCCQLLFQVGALDVFTQPVNMKKSRLGTLITVICSPSQISACEGVLFRETTTIGIRRQFQQRNVLKREIQEVETSLGKVRVKVAWVGDQMINLQPEYEDCVRLAQQHQLPLKQVQKVVFRSMTNDQ